MKMNALSCEFECGADHVFVRGTGRTGVECKGGGV